MKSIKFFFACVLALTFVACSNAESDSFEDNTSNFESMKSLYGIESAAYDPKAEEIPSVTAEEMASVLEALRQNGNTVRNCESETTEGFYGDATDKKAVKMLAEYQSRTRIVAFFEQFALCVSLNFNIDKVRCIISVLLTLLRLTYSVGRDMALLYQQLLTVTVSSILLLIFISV